VDVANWMWTVTLVGLVALLLFDLIIIGRRPHEPSMREATIWVVFYIGLAVAFGGLIFGVWGGEYAGQFFAGWLTEYSLSVDNLFVFVIIMARFGVPRRDQQKVLLVGIVLALVLRGAFIAAGAAAIERFSWVFYLFGIFLIYTAVKLTRNGESDQTDFKENPLVRWSRRILPMTPRYEGSRLTGRDSRGRLMFTPMVVVLIAIGTTDLIFALDSIPAIFGLTQEPYLVFTANVFALMGLRQLYFLLGGLLDRLVYLSVGLAFVLAFIGVKLLLEAAAENHVPFINDGQPITWAPHIGIEVSLAVIMGTLGVTTIASLVKSRRDARRVKALQEVEASAIGNSRRNRTKPR
jgi:tellurite resistance protein TerC